MIIKTFDNACEVILRSTARGLHWLLVSVPVPICRLPHLPDVLGLVYLYIFFQALALLWMAGIIMISICSIQVVECASVDCLHGVSARSAVTQLARGYVFYSIVRVSFFAGNSVYNLGWEAYSDFPTVKRLIEGKRRSPPKEPDPDEKERWFRKRTRAQWSLIAVRALGLIFIQLLLGLATWTCNSASAPSICAKNEYLSALTDPTSRMNRTLRFTLLVLFLSWAQQFVVLFPHWHSAIGTSTRRFVAVALLSLMPLTFARVLLWSLRPSGVGRSETFFGLKNHLWDQGLVFFWMLWMLQACRATIGGRSIKISGFRRMSVLEQWPELTALFKYTYVVPLGLHFIRGCISPRIGFANAQSDTLLVALFYPGMMCMTWSLTYAVVVAPQRRRIPAVLIMSFVAAVLVCYLAEFVTEGNVMPRFGAILLVWVHLTRRWLRLYGSKRRFVVNRDGSPQPRRGSKKAFAHESVRIMERWGKHILLISAVIAVTFFSVLVGLGTLSALQQRHDLFFQTISWNSQISPSKEFAGTSSEELLEETIIDHVVSRLVLKVSSDSAGRPSPPIPQGPLNQSLVHYAACGHLWHGLSLVDFSLLSLAAYFDHNDPALPGLLKKFFPDEPASQPAMRWRLGESAVVTLEGGRQLAWLEIEMIDEDVIIIAVRGTDPARVSDYIEDILLWTEPVTMSIISSVFPSVRIWPRGTHEMVIRVIHDILASLGFPDRLWSYTALIDRVNIISEHKKVVFTGHSLGGSIAAVVAALTGWPSVSIAPPGIYYSFAKHQHNLPQKSFGPSRPNPTFRHELIHHNSITVSVEGDWVGIVFDSHAGLVQTITCDQHDQALHLACHMIEGTLCHLLQHCGDHRGRWHSCSFEYGIPRWAASALWNRAKDAMPKNMWKFVQSILGEPRYFYLGMVLLVGFCLYFSDAAIDALSEKLNNVLESEST